MNGVLQEDGRRHGSHYYHVGDGFHFNINRHTPMSIYFVCHRSSCGGRALLRMGGRFEHTLPHNHPPDHLFTRLSAARSAILTQARSLAYLSFSEILASERRRIADRNIRAELTLRRLRPAMQRSRAEIFPPVPECLEELALVLENPAWESLTKTVDLEDCLYLGSVQDNDGYCSIVFISARCLEVMRIVDILFSDGTFYITPSIQDCYQVFTIVTIHGHTVIPLLWCLMERKTESAYVAVLSLVRTRLITWNFSKVVSDYEDAIINAFRIVFGVDVQGCLFHSAHAMALYARSTIGTAVISLSEEIRNVVHFCCALPLLPQNLLQRGLDGIRTEVLNLGDDNISLIVTPYLDYVDRDWVNHVNRSHCLSVCESAHRTNNASECNNRRMKRLVRTHHPNPFRFVRHVADFEDDTVDDLFSISRGNIPTRHRAARAVSNDAHIRRITRDLLQLANPSHEDIMTFLSSAALSLKRVVYEAINIPMQPDVDEL